MKIKYENMIDQTKQMFYNSKKYKVMEMILLRELDENNNSFESIRHIDENGVEFW